MKCDSSGLYGGSLMHLHQKCTTFLLLPAGLRLFIRSTASRECHGPALGDPLKNQKQIQREDLFLEIAMFLGRKLTKPGQIQSCKISFSFFD